MVQDFPHYSIKTNNYIESWHHHLKMYYLKLMQHQRIDVILHILSEKVEPDFHRAELCVTMAFENTKLSKEEQESQHLAEELDSATMHDMVHTYNDGDEKGEVSVCRALES
jgi:hypothetical protein